MQVLDRRKAMSITPLFRLAFRPFSSVPACWRCWRRPPCGCWPSAASSAIGNRPVAGWPGTGMNCLASAWRSSPGSLLTAVQTWTGRPEHRWRTLALLAGLWLAGRLGWLFSLHWPLLAVLELTFPWRWRR